MRITEPSKTTRGETTNDAGPATDAQLPRSSRPQHGPPHRPPRRPRSRRKRIVFALLMLAMTLLTVGVIGEVAARLLIGAPMPERRPLLIVEADPDRGWRMQPDQPHFTYIHPTRTNRLGLRGPEIGDKQPGETRILLLGDSLIYGQGVPDEGTLPALLEKQLNQEGEERRHFTVINSGHRGYATNQQLALLRQLGRAIEPDVVVLCWYWNDLEEWPIDFLYQNYRRMGPVAFDVKARMEGSTLRRWRAQQLARRSALLMWMHDVYRVLTHEPLPREQVEQGLAHFEAYLGEFLALAERHEFTFVMAIIPDPNALRGESEAAAWVDEVRSIAADAGVTPIELLDAARRADRGGWTLPVVPFDGHYNSEANAEMAKDLATALMNVMEDQ